MRKLVEILHATEVHVVSGVLGGGIRGYTPYTNLRGFLTAYTHLSDYKQAGYLQALRHAALRIPTSIFSNTPLHVVTIHVHRPT